MPYIRISSGKNGDETWWTLVKSGPIGRVCREPIYAISTERMQLLRRKKLPFELIPESDTPLSHSRPSVKGRRA